MENDWQILQGDVREKLRELSDESVHCIILSPPYWGLRDYGVEDQLGLEPTLDLYIEHMVTVARELKRVLRKDGTMWWNHGDCYAQQGGSRKTDAERERDKKAAREKGYRHGGWDGSRKAIDRAANTAGDGLKPKDLVLQPHRVALALQADGWWLRSAIVWAKGLSFCDTYSGSVMPESCKDRPTSAYEMVFLFTKSAKYYYDIEAVREDVPSYTWDGFRHNDMYTGNQAFDNSTQARANPSALIQGRSGRNLRNVWTINPQSFPEAHFATFPEKLVEPCIRAGTSEKGCCPECGAPWERMVADATGGSKGRAWHDHSADEQRGNSKVESSKGYRPGQTIGWQPTCICGKHRLIPQTELDADPSLIEGDTEIEPFEPIPCTILDPFSGSGTTGVVALREGRKYIGIELNPEYVEMSETRLAAVTTGVAVREQRQGQKGLF